VGRVRYVFGARLAVDERAPTGIWFHCKGCGAEAGYFPEPYTSGGRTIPIGSIMHTRAPGARMPCVLYRQLEPDQFWDVHRDAPRINPPDRLEPILG